jgi:hypothetical protein
MTAGSKKIEPLATDNIDTFKIFLVCCALHAEFILCFDVSLKGGAVLQIL